MAEVIKFLDSIETYNDFVGAPTEHPLAAAIDMSTWKPIPRGMVRYGVYCIMLTFNSSREKITYGKHNYVVDDGNMLFISPGQLLGAQGHGYVTDHRGYVIVFHPDLLIGNPLCETIKDYHFFSYDANE